jgi:hypothetical protein
MDRGVMLGVADRKMTHETKEDEGDQWTRVMRCVRCLYLGEPAAASAAAFKFLSTKERAKQTYSQGVLVIISKIKFTNTIFFLIFYSVILFQNTFTF